MGSLEMEPWQYGYLTISIIAIILNTTVIYLYLTRKYLRNMHSNIFLFSLAISDLCYAAIAIPLLIKCEQSENAPANVCFAYEYIMVFFGYSTVYHILLAIAEKLCAICFTLKHHSKFSRSIAIKLSLSVWGISLLFTHIPVWWDFNQPGNHSNASSDALNTKNKAYYLFNFATAFALPVLISAIVYSVILHKISKASNARLTENNNNQRCRLHAEKKAAMTFAVMLAAFVFTWSTWFVGRIYEPFVTTLSLYNFLTFCRLLDPIFNPFLYTFLKNDFRRAFLGLLRSKKRENELVRMKLIRRTQPRICGATQHTSNPNSRHSMKRKHEESRHS